VRWLRGTFQAAVQLEEEILEVRCGHHSVDDGSRLAVLALALHVCLMIGVGQGVLTFGDNDGCGLYVGLPIPGLLHLVEGLADRAHSLPYDLALLPFAHTTSIVADPFGELETLFGRIEL
jgi:hypothetical protein